MKRLIGIGSAVASVVMMVSAAGAITGTGNACQPKTSADSGRIRFNGPRAMNTSTTSTATVTCNAGISSSGSTRVTWQDLNPGNTANTNVSCTAFFYQGATANLGTKTSSGGPGGGSFTFTGGPLVPGAYIIECRLPVATGAAETQMSSVEDVGN